MIGNQQICKGNFRAIQIHQHAYRTSGERTILESAYLFPIDGKGKVRPVLVDFDGIDVL